MKPRMDLLYLDEHLFRSWFSVVPLENLTSYLENSMEYLSHVPARVLDCFQGVSYRLRGLGKVSQQNTEVCCGADQQVLAEQEQVNCGSLGSGEW